MAKAASKRLKEAARKFKRTEPGTYKKCAEWLMFIAETIREYGDSKKAFE